MDQQLAMDDALSARPSVSVVIVTYQSEDVVVDAVSALPSGIEVLVVEQHLAAASARRAVQARGPGVRVIYAGANRGFGAGCNLGAAEATGDVVIFLNPDARIDGPNLFALVDAVRDRGGSLVGPLIIADDGSPATRARRWSSPVRDALNLLLPHRLLVGRVARELPPSDPFYRAGGEVDIVQGSCFGIARDVFFRVGGFDERYFLYGEEETLARRLGERGLRVSVTTAAYVSHTGHTSTARIHDFAVEQMFRSQAMIYRDRHGRVAGAAASTVLGLAVLVLGLTAPARLPLGIRPSYDSRWCACALRGLRSGILGLTSRRPSEPITDEELWPTS